jgi:guanylate kinase
MPKIFLLDGPAGSGKSTLTPLVLQHFGNKLHHCKRVTTRPQRPDDKNYDYIDQVEFGQYLTEGELAAYRRFRGGYSYGVRRTPVEELVARGLHVFSLMDLGTAEMARRVWPDCVTIFLMAPLEMLERRLHEKSAHSEDQIKERLDNAAKAFSMAAYYDYVIPNRQGQLKKSSEHLISIFEKEMREEGS